MNVLGCLAALVAMAMAYLCSPNQRVFARPLGRPARIAAWVFAVVALAAWIAAETTLPGIVSALTTLMFGAVAMPYLTWLIRPPVARKPR